MRWPNQRISLHFVVLLFLFVLLSLLVVDSQTAWVKTVVASHSFAGKVVGVSDGDTISVVLGGRAVKVRLRGIASMGKAPEGERYV